MDLFDTVHTNDFVEYFIFLTDEKFVSSDKIEEIHNSFTSFAAPIIENYIWHYDEFNISKVVSTKTGSQSWHLHGLLHYGDNIEDEWFVVYLLMLFSKQRNDIFVKVYDSDGEFLLIEASHSSPSWLQSDSCNCQCFIYDGVIRIVPGKFSADLDVISKVSRILKRQGDSLDVEKNISLVIEKKVERFANGVAEFLHQARAFVPVKVAALLDTNPRLIASAVKAYCERDIIDKKLCKTMKHFPPEQLVLRSVKFSRFLYAMISHEKMESENKRTNWTLPSPAEPNFKERVLGFKITCGFEILASKCKSNIESNLPLSKKWLQYVDVLQRKGYFKDFLPGSKDYTNLEKQARNYFLENTDAIKSDSNCILNILQTIEYDYDALKREESSVPPSDDEQWMLVNEENFDNFLRERYDCCDTLPTDSPEVVSSTINTFLNQFSDVEGVELAEKNVDLDSMDLDSDSLLRGISFDADNFLPSLEKMLDKMSVENKMEEFGEVSSVNSSLDSEDGSDTDEAGSNTSEEIDIKSYMQLMDQELKNFGVSEKQIPNNEEANPVDVHNFDTNIFSNILKSYEEQYGGSGPAGNLLHSMGYRLKTKKQD